MFFTSSTCSKLHCPRGFNLKCGAPRQITGAIARICWVHYRASFPAPSATKGPMWGHPMLVLGALCSFLEPFCGHLSPKIDKVCEELTLRYPHEGPWVAPGYVRAFFRDGALGFEHERAIVQYFHRNPAPPPPAEPAPGETPT